MTMTATAPAAAPEGTGTDRRTMRGWLLFVLIGLAIYFGLYAWSEVLVYRHGEANRFFMVRTTPPTDFDYVILGASHAMPFSFSDRNEVLETGAGAKIMPLSIEGTGLVPAQFILDYFKTRHTTQKVIYILDSFAFNGAQWNEDRLGDRGLYKRAPFDPNLALTMWRYPSARPALPAYVSGFDKINNSDRFLRDISLMERERFDRVYRPNAQIDRERLRYLYPEDQPADIADPYYARFAAFAEELKADGIELIVVKPPTPARLEGRLPGEDAYDARVTAFLADIGVPYYDYSDVVTGNEFYFDTDHLNRAGVSAFSEQFFVPLLKRHLDDGLPAEPIIPPPPPPAEAAAAPAATPASPASPAVPAPTPAAPAPP